MKKNFFQLSAILCILSFLTACGTTTRLSSDDISIPIHKGNARIIFERDNALLYMGAAADVSVNGYKVASLGRGGEAKTDVHAGKITVSVSTVGAYGKFSISLDTKAGQTYRLMVSPRSEALLVGSAFGMLGDAVNASINENTGYFQVTPK